MATGDVEISGLIEDESDAAIKFKLDDYIKGTLTIWIPLSLISRIKHKHPPALELDTLWVSKWFLEKKGLA